MSFFNPETQTYGVLVTPPHALHVLPGQPDKRVTVPGSNPMTDSSHAAPETGKKEIQQLGEDILPIHTDAMDLAVPFRSLSKGWIFWLALVGPLSMYLMLLGVLKVQRLSPERLAQSRSKKAFSTLKKRCHKAHADHEEHIHAFKDYLNDRYNLSIGTLTADDAERILLDKGLDAETAKRVRTLMQTYETAVYAGHCFNGSEDPGEMLRLVKSIEKGMS